MVLLKTECVSWSVPMARPINPSNLLAVKRPDLAGEWDCNKNSEIGLSFDSVTCSMKKKAWWICPTEGHSYLMQIDHRVRSKLGCPYCSGRRVLKGFNDLATTHPDIAAEWLYAVDDKSLTPEMVSFGSNVKVMWRCSKHGTEWVTSVMSRIPNKGCNKCRGEKISAKRNVVKPGMSLADKYPDVAREWDYEKNDRTPEQVHAHSRYRAYWKCMTCGNSWDSWVYNRTSFSAGCPECATKRVAKKQRIPKPGMSLLERFPVIASEFVSTVDGETDPRNVSARSCVKCHWKCSVCGETEWVAPPSSRTNSGEDVGGCPKCGMARSARNNRKPRTSGLLVDGAPEIAKEWDVDKNRDEFDMELDMVSMSSNINAYWICSRCGASFRNTANHRTNRGDGCPVCSHRYRTSFPEKAVLFYVKQAYPDALGNHTPDIEGIGHMEYDVWIPSIRTGVEYDGQGWHQSADADSKKEQVSFDNGIRLIRIREDKCVEYQHLLCQVIYRDQNGGYGSLDKAIIELFAILGCDDVPDVDTKRDNGLIRKHMNMEIIASSLSETRPDVAEYWDYERNGDLLPTMFKRNSCEEVNWKCPHCGDTWKLKIVYMTHRRSLCQSCGAKSILSQSRSRSLPGDTIRLPKDTLPCTC